MHQVRRCVVTRCANSQHQRFAVAHCADLAGFTLNRRACVKNIDVALITEAFAFKHVQGRFGVGMHLADHRSGIFGQETGVHRELGHQLGDKGFVAHAGQVVGLAELHFEKVPAQAFPKWRAATFIGHATHFGNDLAAKQLRELGDKQHPRLGQQAAIEPGTVIGTEEQ